MDCSPWLPSEQRLQEEGPFESPQGFFLDFFFFGPEASRTHRLFEGRQAACPWCRGRSEVEEKRAGWGLAWLQAFRAPGLVDARGGSGHFQIILLAALASTTGR